MKSELYSSEKIRCSLISQSHNLKKQSETYKTIILSQTPGKVTWELSGDAFCIWPNREGEGFYLSNALSRLADIDPLNHGLSISYPATASMTAFLVKEENGHGFLFFMEADEMGRVREIRIKRGEGKNLLLEVSAVQKNWIFFTFRNEEELYQRFCGGNACVESIQRQFQLGLIAPDCISEIPESKGFDIIPEVAEQIISLFGSKGNLIHLFGYSKGHDVMYPDYNPSELLGGLKKLKSAVHRVKSMGFETSFYLNGRIIDSKALGLFPKLKKSILLDIHGKMIKEIYQNRIFYVLDPSSSDWEDCLLHWSQVLAECGADTIQLDQLGGRAAVKNTGEIWGQGYNRIIRGIQNLGMKVWIQGVSDYYCADRFEMTFRELNILKGGILRGGNPFGEIDLSLVQLFLKNKSFLVTESKLKKMKNRKGLHFVLDYPDYKGQLPMYSSTYINMLNNAQAALR